MVPSGGADASATRARPRGSRSLGADSTGGLIHRQRELSHILSILEDLRQGGSGTMILRGPPGVGKTALLQAAAEAATGISVVQFRGTTSATPPSREWPDPFVELLVKGGPPTERVNRPPGADHGRSPARGGGSADESVVEAASRAFERMTHFAHPPLLVLVDDAHLVPQWFSSALLATADAGELGFAVGVVLAVRDTPLMPIIEFGLPEIPEHQLGSLDVDASGLLLERNVVATPDASVCKALVRATAGVPQALIDAAGRLSPAQLRGIQPLPVPIEVDADLCRAFGPVLDGLSTPARLAVAVAALGIPSGVLSAALDSLGSDPKALEEVRDAGVVAVRQHRVDFSHPLIRSAAFWLLETAERDRVQAAVAEAYREAGDVERAALHLGLSRRAPDDTVAHQYGAAARLAGGRADPRRAAAFQEMAAAFASSVELECAHLARAAAYWLLAGDVERSVGLLVTVDESSVSDHVRAEVLYERAAARFAAGLPGAPRADMVRAAELCERLSPQRAVILLVDAATCELMSIQPEDVDDIVERAVGLSRGVSSFFEALAETLRWITGRGEGTRLVSVLMGQSAGFPACPYLALLVGRQLVAEAELDLALRWARWVDRAASAAGSQPLRAVAATLTAQLAVYRGDFDEAAQLAAQELETSDVQLVGVTLAVLSSVSAMVGDHRTGLEVTSRLFALPEGSSPLGKVAAQVALARLELGRGRSSLAAAWLRPAVEQVRGAAVSRPHREELSAAWFAIALGLAETLLVAGDPVEARSIVDLVAGSGEKRRASGERLAPRLYWLEELCSDDPDRIETMWSGVSSRLAGRAFIIAYVELLVGARQAQLGLLAESRTHLGRAQVALEALGAEGLVAIARSVLGRLGTDRAPERAPSDGSRPGGAPEASGAGVARGTSGESTADPGGVGAGAGSSPDPSDGARREASSAEATGPRGATGSPGGPLRAPGEVAEWEIDLLGQLDVRHRGEAVVMPYSLAVQALMITSLRRRIPIEELVDLLWPDAEPGVGMRRLRNVLWRIRSACGDILVRDGSLIRLDDRVVVDVELFRALAREALAAEGSGAGAGEPARAALTLYQGELLPAERYADWAAGPRESLSRLHIQLLELLLAEAVAAEHLQDAFGFVDRLIECDPYNEQHHLVLAELYAKTGNRQRALRVLEQAEAVLDELDLPPSDELKRIRRALNGIEAVDGRAR